MGISDRQALDRILEVHQPDAVMRLAAATGPQRVSQKTFAFTMFRLTRSLGRWGPQGSSEDAAYDPRSPYSASKAASDHLVRAWHETYRLPVVLSNCSNNYGP